MIGISVVHCQDTGNGNSQSLQDSIRYVTLPSGWLTEQFPLETLKNHTSYGFSINTFADNV